MGVQWIEARPDTQGSESSHGRQVGQNHFQCSLKNQHVWNVST